MKSVMEEASSIAKAIEQAWERVGKPREFTVKVFEEAKHSFFGFTKQSAKIALIFDERTLTEKPKSAQEKPTFVKSTPEKQKFKQQPQKEHIAHSEVNRRPDKQKPAPQQAPLVDRQKEKSSGAAQEQVQKVLWTDEMINSARAWVQHNLNTLGLPNIKFDTTAQKYHLRFQFDTCVLENREKEKKLFSTFAHLIMSTMRNKFKKEFRGLKVVLSSK